MLSARCTTFYWITLLTLVVAGVGQVVSRGINIQRDLFSTLPAVSREEGFLNAQEEYQDRLGRKMIFAVVGEDSSQLQKVMADFEQTLKKDFSNIQYKFDETRIENIGKLYVPYRQQLLTGPQIEEINSTPALQLVEKNLARLYSPIGSLQAGQLAADPFGYFTNFLLSLRVDSTLKSQDGLLLGELNNKPAAVLFADIKGDWQDYSKQIEIKNLVENFKAKNSSHQILTVGLANYMRAGVERAQVEISTIGLGSLLGAIILLLWIFKSAAPLVVSVGLLLASVLSAALITHLFFGSIHFFTLILGSSIVGMIDDYSFHFFSQRFDGGVKSGTQARDKIKRSLVYSFITTIIGFIFLFATPFPVLKQLGIFAIAGFATAFLIIWTFYQHLPHRFSTYPQFWKRGAGFTHRLIAIRKSHFAVAAACLLAVSALMMTKIQFSDDVRLLQSLPKDLKSDDDNIRALLGQKESQTYLLVRGETFEELLKREEALQLTLAENFQTGFSGISNWIPSETKQKESFETYQKLKPAYREFYQKLNVPRTTIEAKMKIHEAAFRAIPIEQLRSNIATLPIGQQFLGQFNSQYYSVLHLPSELAANRFKSLESSNVQVINLAEDTSKIMHDLRSAITWAAIAGWVITFLTIAILIGGKNSIHIILAPTLAVLLALGFTFTFTGPLNLFHLLAAVLVFTLGIDYTFFFSDCHDSVYVPTLIAVTAAAITTGLSFGLMSLSQTAAISGFGVTIAIGITLCLILSPFAVRARL